MIRITKARGILESRRGHVVREYLQGLRPIRDIGDEIGCSYSAVRNALKDWGVLVPGRHNLSMFVLDPKHDAEIVRLHGEGLSVKAIAGRMGISRPTVALRARELGLALRGRVDYGPELEARASEITGLFDEGLSPNQIGEKIGYHGNHIRDLLKRHGRRISLNTYDVDVDFFARVNTQEKAYVLGLWYADGNVGDHTIRIEIKDVELLEKVKAVMGYTGPILACPDRDHRTGLYKLSIARMKLVRDIASKGCTPAKSLVLKFPSRKIVPPSLVRHMVRGYFDGDGCLGRHRKSWVVQIIGTREFLEGMREASGLNGYWNHHQSHRKKNTWGWNLSARAEVRCFLDWIYDGSTIHLDRKHALYLKVISSTS